MHIQCIRIYGKLRNYNYTVVLTCIHPLSLSLLHSSWPNDKILFVTLPTCTVELSFQWIPWPGQTGSQTGLATSLCHRLVQACIVSSLACSSRCLWCLQHWNMKFEINPLSFLHSWSIYPCCFCIVTHAFNILHMLARPIILRQLSTVYTLVGTMTQALSQATASV